MGQLLPYGLPWRLGANEAATIDVEWENIRVRIPVEQR